jgi:hypothetical protein
VRRVNVVKLNRSLLLALSFALFVITGSTALAQETIFNVPSGDVLDRGKVYGELDFSFLWDASTGTYTPRLVAGIGHRIEVGVNVNGISSPCSRPSSSGCYRGGRRAQVGAALRVS